VIWSDLGSHLANILGFLVVELESTEGGYIPYSSLDRLLSKVLCPLSSFPGRFIVKSTPVFFSLIKTDLSFVAKKIEIKLAHLYLQIYLNLQWPRE